MKSVGSGWTCIGFGTWMTAAIAFAAGTSAAQDAAASASVPGSVVAASESQAPVPHDGAVVGTVSPALERWHVDAARSTIGFDGTSTLHDFTGKTKAVAGEIRFDPDAVAACAGGAVWIDAKTLDTDSEKRDTDMRSTLGVDEYHEIVFTLDRVEGRMAERRGEFTGHGRFFIHGYEQPKVVHFRTEPTADGALHVLGEAHVKLSEHDLKPPSVLFVTVGDDVRVWLDLTFVRVPEVIVDAHAHDIVVATQVTIAPQGGAARKPATPAITAAPTNTAVHGQLILSAQGSLWEHVDAGDAEAPTSVWSVVHDGRYEIFDAAHATPIVARASKSDTRGPNDRTRAEAKGDAKSVARVERRDVDAHTVVLLVDGRECVTLEGLEGNEAFAGLLPALRALSSGFPDGSPVGFEETLRGVSGIPSHVRVHTVNGTTTYDADVRIDPSSHLAQLRTWALEPDAWSRPPAIKTKRLVTSKDWRASQKEDP